MRTFKTGCHPPDNGFPFDSVHRDRYAGSNLAREAAHKVWDGQRASRYRGVQKKRDKWCARIQDRRTGYRNINLGTFANELHAALAYDAALYVFGEPPLRAWYFQRPHIQSLDAFICAIAHKLGRTYPTL